MEKNICDICNATQDSSFTKLNCRHQVCSSCFYKLCLCNKKEVFKTFSTNDEVNFNCLKCGKGSVNLKKKQISEVLKKTVIGGCQVKTCLNHMNEAKFFCKKCEWLMCNECLDQHKSIPLFMSHEIINDIKESAELVIKYCDKHSNKQIEYQCMTCKIPICDKCFTLLHNNHEIKDIKEYFIEKKEEIKKIQLPFKTFEEFKTNLQEQENKITSSIRNKSSYFIDQIVNIMTHFDNLKTLMINKVNQVEDDIITNNEIIKTIYQKLYEDVENLSYDDYLNLQNLIKMQKENSVLITDITSEKLTDFIEKTKNNINSFKKDETYSNMISVNYEFTERVEKPTMPALKTIKAHDQGVFCLIQLKDENLASGSSDKKIKIWDKNNYSCLQTLSGHTGDVFCLTQFPNELLASGSEDCTIKLWNPKEKFICIKTISNHKGSVNSLMVLNDLTWLSCSNDCTVMFRDYSNYFEAIYRDHTDSVLCLVKLGDTKFASGSDDKSIRIWNYDSLKINVVKIIKQHEGGVISLAKLKNNLLASGSEDCVINIYDMSNNYNVVFILKGHANSIQCLIELSDGKLASCSNDKSIRIWEPIIFNCTKKFNYHTNYVYCLLQLKNGKLASGSEDSTIRISDYAKIWH